MFPKNSHLRMSSEKDHLQCRLFEFLNRFLFEGITGRFGLSLFCRGHSDPKVPKKYAEITKITGSFDVF